MATRGLRRAQRRRFLNQLACGAGWGALGLAAGCHAARREVLQTPGSRLRVAFSNAGLQTTWCKLGYDTAMLWGRILNLEIVWIDGELKAERQRENIEARLGEDWDFCCFQAKQEGTLEKPVRALKKRGIPVISVDTLLVQRQRLREVGVWVQVAADHVQMGESSTRYLMEKIGGKGQVIHIGGDSAHSGARQREQGFNNILASYPEVRVVGGGVRWCDWEPEKARNTFQTLLTMTNEPIAGAFFHNDDMALASYPALANTIHKDMVITAVDGQKDGLTGVQDGRLAATTVNPTCLVHAWSLLIGQFIVRNREKLEDVPLEIPCPCPLVSKESGNLEAMFYLSDPRHCMV
ncbi:MAG: sugar ABC transporter substrate-binding protein [Thermoguttaceae bacterium]